MICWKCGKEYDGEVHRTTVCGCGADLHSCYNCKFYLEGNHYDCAETVDDIVSDKEKSNFCDYFSAGKNSKNKSKYDISSSGSETGSDAKSAAEALFGGDAVKETKSGKDAFDSLFGGL